MRGEPARIPPTAAAEQLWKESGRRKNSSSFWFLFRHYRLLFWLGFQTGSGGGWKMSKSPRLIAWVDAAIAPHFLIANLKLLVIYYQPIENPTHTLPLNPIKDSKPITWLSIKSVNQILSFLLTILSHPILHRNFVKFLVREVSIKETGFSQMGKPPSPF